MNINPIQTTSKFNENSKTSNNASRIDVDFSDVLSNTRIKALTPSEAEDIGWNGILSQINNEPPEDREEDLRLFSQFKHTAYVFFPPSLEEQKKKIPCFPPATVPGHIRAKFNDFFNNIATSSDEKDNIILNLRNDYSQYCKENPNKTLDTYNKDNLKSLISYLVKSIDYPNATINSSIKDSLNKFLKYLQ